MEHLILPKGEEWTDADVVPYLSREDYESIPFMDYPLHQGIDIPLDGTGSGFLYGAVRCMGTRQQETFMQSWLFFGLLQEVLGKFYHHEDFVRVSRDKTKVVTTQRLESILIRWSEQVFSKSYLQQFIRCFKTARSVLDSAHLDFDIRIWHSITATGEILAHAVNKFLYPFYGEDVTEKDICNIYWTDSTRETASIESMGKNSWCRRQAFQALQQFSSTQTLHLLRKMAKSDLDCAHDACTSQRCRNPDTFQSRHRDTQCTCEDIEISEGTLTDILNAGSIPLLKINFKGTCSVDVIPSSGNTRYVALSHVWADGLGNPRSNALPRCQLVYLSQRLALFGSHCNEEEILLWLDTLCVPARQGPGKDLALTKMRWTYLEASHVLVLDSSLLPIAHKGLMHLELSARILTSTWIHRLWTLQEAVLAERLWVQFSDGLVDVNELANQAVQSFVHGPPSLAGLALDMSMFHKAFRKTSTNFQDPSDVAIAATLQDTSSETTALVQRSLDILPLVQSVRDRSVTCAFDEPLCLATLFSLDSEELVNTCKEMRMKKLWSLLRAGATGRRIPQTIIFLDAPRLQYPGFGWAPSKLLGIAHADTFFSSRAKSANFCDEGLLCQFPAFGLAKARSLVPLPDKFLKSALAESAIAKSRRACHLRDSVGRWYTVCFNEAISENDPSLLQMIQQGNHVIVIAEDSLDTQYALLMELVRVEGGTAYLRTKSHLGISPQPEVVDQMLRVAYDIAHRIQDEISQQPKVTNSSAAESKHMIQEAVKNMMEQEVELVHGLRQIVPDVVHSLEKAISFLYAGHYAVKGADLGPELCIT